MQLEIFRNVHVSTKDGNGKTVNAKDDLNQFMRQHNVIKTETFFIPSFIAPNDSKLKQAAGSFYYPLFMILVWYDDEAKNEKD